MEPPGGHASFVIIPGSNLGGARPESLLWPMNRRLLLLSYHFGPGCATGGLRWNAMAPYLAGAGWEVEVISAPPPGSGQPYQFAPGVRVTPVPPPTWVGDAVQGVGKFKRRLLRQDPPAPETARPDPTVEAGEPESVRPSLRLQVYSSLMGNVGALSRWSLEAGWSRRAVQAGRVIARDRPPAVVLVSSPPHATQLAGVALGRRLGVPTVCDFRDPWVFGEWDAAEAQLIDLWRGRWAQRRTFAAATSAVFNTEWARRAAVAHDPSLGPRSVAIPNGYDPRPSVDRPDQDLFRVAFVGWLYDFMDPEPVLAACGRLLARVGPGVLRVEFVGTDHSHGGRSLRARARAHGLGEAFQHHPRVSREEALRWQERAAVQIVFDTPGPLRVPTKFYDSVQNYGDLLLIGRPESALGDAAAQVGFPVCSAADPAAIDAALDRAFRRWRAREFSAPLDARGLFSRERAGHQILDLLDQLAVRGIP